MDGKIITAELLKALERKFPVAIAFARKCGIRDPDFVTVAVQEAAVRILSGAGLTFDPTHGSSADGYVGRILYNVCCRQLKTFYQSIPVPDGFDPATSDWNPVDIAIRREQVSEAEVVIGRLPVHLQAAARRSPERRRPVRPGGLRIRRTSTGDVHYFRAKGRFLEELIELRREKRPSRRTRRK